MTPERRTQQDVCPRCGGVDAALSLLTAMNKYFACLHCRHRWHRAVDAQ